MKTVSNKKILIVEDEEESQKIFRRMLVGYDLSFCVSEMTLMEKLRESEYGLILMDIGLAGSKDGLMLIRELKSTPKYSSIPIISVTSRVYSKQRILATEAGAAAYLTKPISKTLLIETIEKCLIQ